MDFELTEDQEELRASVAEVLARECPVAVPRERVERGTIPAQPWQSACELGWPAIAVPERFGGLGLGFVEVAITVLEHGRALAPGPFLATVTQFAPLVREAGDETQQERWLSPLAEGTLTGTLAISGPSGALLEPDAALQAVPSGAGWRLTGTRHHVIDGDEADEIIAVARVEQGDGLGLFVVPREAVKSERLSSLDATRSLATLDFDSVEIAADRALGTPGAVGSALQRALHESVAALACEMVGTSQAIFDQTLEYAKTREQFRRPIGSFQATQHKFTNLFVVLEKARATADFAAMAIAEDDPRRALAASMAKASAGECQRSLAKEGIQIHGGLGYTWEHNIHLFVKRVKSSEALLGTAASHRARVADLLEI